MSSPTQRTLDLLRKRGYRPAVVERWNPHTNIRQDLFGCIDVLAIGNGETIAVQCTSKQNMRSRINKIQDSDALFDMRDAGWRVLVHGWHQPKKKPGTRWACQEVDIS